MRKSQLLWIDLRRAREEPCVDHKLNEIYQISVSHDLSNTATLIKKHQPRIICFDYDFPDQQDLDILLQTRTHFPELPVLMLSKEQSLDLALWALRSRVWNYFVKPIIVDNYIHSVDVLLNINQNGHANRMPLPISQVNLNFSRDLNVKSVGLATQLAAEYVVEHCQNKLSLDKVAGLCYMSKSHFSRSFKRDHGITFQQFLMQQRINKAATLLKQSDISVTEVALSVGFSDLSHFNRTFNKCIGVAPTRFRLGYSA